MLMPAEGNCQVHDHSLSIEDRYLENTNHIEIRATFTGGRQNLAEIIATICAPSK